MREQPLTLAVPKGRVLDEAVALFQRAGIDLGAVRGNSRRLVHEVEGPSGALRVYVVRDADVPAYVEGGAADVGVAGRDVLEEQGRDLYEPLDLRIGRCRLSVAEPAARPVDDRAELHLRVATKFPNLTRRHLEAKGIVADVIKLYGSIELAPLTGLADRIVDLVSTGETLRQHHLREVETVLEVSARLVVNRASLKLRRAAIDGLIGRLRAAVR
jgi:ATP phosphoribosyltransferase